MKPDVPQTTPVPGPPTAVFIGRFQPFHVGHLDAFSRMRLEMGKVKILVGSSNRSRTADNPMTFTERRAYIRSIVGAVPVLPLPDDPSDAVWISNLRKRMGKGAVVYSGNDWVRGLCEQAGIPFRGIVYHEDVSATRIRGMIARGDPGYAAYLVNKRLPEAVFEVLRG